MPGAELRSLRKVMVVVLVFLCFGITVYAFSSVVQKNWHSRLQKGEYTPLVADEMPLDEEATEPEESEEPQEEPQFTDTPPNVIVSEPVQIFVDTPEGEADEEEHTDEEPEEMLIDAEPKETELGE